MSAAIVGTCCPTKHDGTIPKALEKAAIADAPCLEMFTWLICYFSLHPIDLEEGGKAALYTGGHARLPFVPSAAFSIRRWIARRRKKIISSSAVNGKTFLFSQMMTVDGLCNGTNIYSFWLCTFEACGIFADSLLFPLFQPHDASSPQLCSHDMSASARVTRKGDFLNVKTASSSPGRS